MRLIEGDLVFEFNNAVDAFKFDETDKTSVHYHGLSHCMKGVDFIVELQDIYLFVEIKDPGNSLATEERREKFKTKAASGELIPELVQKYRDTFLYRWAENKIDKPIKYVCLVTLENALVSSLMKQLKKHVPEGDAGLRWQHGIAQSCIIANIKTWNHSFNQWPVQRVSG